MITAVIWIITFVALLFASAKIERLQATLRERQREDYQQALDDVAWLVSAQHTAAQLRSAAARWDSVEQQHAIALLRDKHVVDGPSIPALWLLAEADRIEANK